MPTTHFNGKTVCVTGAGGSIGSELCAQLIDFHEVDRLILVSVSESALYNINKRLAKPAEVMGVDLQLVLADVNQYNRMLGVLGNTDIVIHAAAHKHVPLCELNPLEAIRNNVGGTFNLARAARDAGVRQFLFVSTDKAVRPASIMGATKRASELLLASLFDETAMKVNVVRFGNVFDSAGSVFPLWREQIAKGGPVTITDPACERYFMTIPQAVSLILAVLEFDCDNRCPHVFNMGKPHVMGEMLRALLKEEKAPKTLEIKITGLRPGEKIAEELSYGGELQPTANARISFVCDEGELQAKDLLSLLTHTEDHNEKDALAKLWEIVK